MAGVRPPVEERVTSAAPVTVTVRGIAAGGSGVADLPDGRVVFVPRTAPGDRVTVHVEKSKPRWALGSLAAVLERAGAGRRRGSQEGHRGHHRDDGAQDHG